MDIKRTQDGKVVLTSISLFMINDQISKNCFNKEFWNVRNVFYDSIKNLQQVNQIFHENYLHYTLNKIDKILLLKDIEFKDDDKDKDINLSYLNKINVDEIYFYNCIIDKIKHIDSIDTFYLRFDNCKINELLFYQVPNISITPLNNNFKLKHISILNTELNLIKLSYLSLEHFGINTSKIKIIEIEDNVNIGGISIQYSELNNIKINPRDIAIPKRDLDIQIEDSFYSHFDHYKFTWNVIKYLLLYEIKNLNQISISNTLFEEVKFSNLSFEANKHIEIKNNKILKLSLNNIYDCKIQFSNNTIDKLFFSENITGFIESKDDIIYQQNFDNFSVSNLQINIISKIYCLKFSWFTNNGKIIFQNTIESKGVIFKEDNIIPCKEQNKIINFIHDETKKDIFFQNSEINNIYFWNFDKEYSFKFENTILLNIYSNNYSG